MSSTNKNLWIVLGVVTAGIVAAVAFLQAPDEAGTDTAGNQVHGAAGSDSGGGMPAGHPAEVTFALHPDLQLRLDDRRAGR